MMTGLISRKPLVGFVTSILFGALGMLLIKIDPVPGRTNGSVLWLFGIVGYFALFVALVSLMNALYALLMHKGK
jgi:hypothetical protein